MLILLGNVPSAAAQDAPQQAASTPEQEKELQRLQAEQEVAGLPRVTVQSIAQLVRFSIEDDRLSARTTLSPIDGEVRVIASDLPGIIRMRVLDLPAVEDPSTGRNFTFIQNDLSQPGGAHAITNVASIAGRLMMSRDADSGTVQSSVQLMQDPPGAVQAGMAEQPVRLLVRISLEGADEPKVDLTLTGTSFSELRRKYPRELEIYLRPILRDLRQDQSIFAVDPRVAWQVLGGDFTADAQQIEQVKQVLAEFDAEDFRRREAAIGQLRKIGAPAALVLQRMERHGFSAEQNAGVDTFLAEYLPLKPADADRLRANTDFLLDALESDDRMLRELALAQLRRACGGDINFDPDAPPQVRQTMIQAIRDRLHRESGAPEASTQPK